MTKGHIYTNIGVTKYVLFFHIPFLKWEFIYQKCPEFSGKCPQTRFVQFTAFSCMRIQCTIFQTAFMLGSFFSIKCWKILEKLSQPSVMFGYALSLGGRLPFATAWCCLLFLKKLGRLHFWKKWGRVPFLKKFRSYSIFLTNWGCLPFEKKN